MSSPPDSLHDYEDAASKKRGRAQSVEPMPAPKDETEIDKAPAVSAPKKTKRDDECPSSSKSNSVSTIRKNMKDMSTTDKTVDTLDDSMASDSQEPDEDTSHVMDTINEEGSDTQNSEHQAHDHHSSEEHNDINNKDQSSNTNTIANSTSTASTDNLNEQLNNSNKATRSFSQFGSKGNGDSNDWSEFADDNEDDAKESKAPASPSQQDKPKYTFGSSSGFGTKGWGSTHQSTTNTPKTTSFSGLSGSTFGSSTAGLGGFSSSSIPSSYSSSQSSTPPASIKPKSAFGAFANAPTSSPFALAAVSGTTNALSSLPKVNAAAALSPGADSTSSVTSSEHPDGSTADDEQEDQHDKQNGTGTFSFGEGSKIKVPGVKQTEVKTGEEDEDTVYQTKAKLLVLDATTNNWKERGGGTFRINIKQVETQGQTTTQSRLVMRADSVYRLILNLLLFAEMKVFIMQDRFVRFAGFESETKEDGTKHPKLVNYALKVANPSAAQELHYQITSRIPTKAK